MLTVEARITASCSRKSVKWLVRLKGPVSHFPAGTTSIPPPLFSCFASSAIAFLNAAVLHVLPSPTAPKSLILTVWARHGWGWPDALGPPLRGNPVVFLHSAAGRRMQRRRENRHRDRSFVWTGAIVRRGVDRSRGEIYKDTDCASFYRWEKWKTVWICWNWNWKGRE